MWLLLLEVSYFMQIGESIEEVRKTEQFVQST